MAYLQSTVSDKFDFISALRAFMLGQGWTQVYYQAGEIGNLKGMLTMSWGDQYYYITTTDTASAGGFYIYGGQGWTTPAGEGSADDLTDRGSNLSCNISISPEATPVTFFGYNNPDGSKQVICVYEPPGYQGIVSYLSFGKVVPAYGSTGTNSYYGCSKWGGTNYPTYVLAMLDAAGSNKVYPPAFNVNMSNDIRPSQWFDNRGPSSLLDGSYGTIFGGNGVSHSNGSAAAGTTGTGNCLYFGMDNWMYRMSEAEHVPTTPVLFFNKYEDGSREFLAGTIPNIRRCSSLMYDPGQVTTIGADEYAVFPLSKRYAVSVSDIAANNQPGFAIKVDRT